MTHQKGFLVLAVWLSFIIPVVSTAQAEQVTLPSRMLGSWCGEWDWQFPFDPHFMYHMRRAKDVSDCGDRGGILLSKDGWRYYRFDDWGQNCRFTGIKFGVKAMSAVDHVRPRKDPDSDELVEPTSEPPSDIYRIAVSCEGHSKPWHLKFRIGDLEQAQFWIQTADDWLILMKDFSIW
jgi:hypothetical protein